METLYYDSTVLVKPFHKKLNNTNIAGNCTGYGITNSTHAWQGARDYFLKLYGEIENSGYSLGYIDEVRQKIKENAGYKDLRYLNEVDLALFYIYGELLLKQYKKEKAIACFIIVYSQAGFGKYMLKYPIQFSNFIDLAEKKLEEISSTTDSSLISNCNTDDFLKDLKGGCFIATAVYGSSYASEVTILKEFRDNWLLNYSLGKIFVNIYYKVSPPIANKIAKHENIKKIIKLFLIIPLIKLANNAKRKGK